MSNNITNGPSHLCNSANNETAVISLVSNTERIKTSAVAMTLAGPGVITRLRQEQNEGAAASVERQLSTIPAENEALRKKLVPILNKEGVESLAIDYLSWNVEVVCLESLKHEVEKLIEETLEQPITKYADILRVIGIRSSINSEDCHLVRPGGKVTRRSEPVISRAGENHREVLTTITALAKDQSHADNAAIYALTTGDKQLGRLETYLHGETVCKFSDNSDQQLEFGLAFRYGIVDTDNTRINICALKLPSHLETNNAFVDNLVPRIEREEGQPCPIAGDQVVLKTRNGNFNGRIWKVRASVKEIVNGERRAYNAQYIIKIDNVEAGDCGSLIVATSSQGQPTALGMVLARIPYPDTSRDNVMLQTAIASNLLESLVFLTRVGGKEYNLM